MGWLSDLLIKESAAHTLLVLAGVIGAGLLLGKIRIRGVSFGIAGVLFAGIIAAHLGVSLPEPVLDFARDFGLIIFVFMVGLQVGPAFFASFRRQGLAINLMAAGIVLLGAGLAAALRLVLRLPIEAAVGVLAGAVTNTPSLGAAQQALKDIAGGSAAVLRQAGLGYAVAYPFGVLGVIAAMVLVRYLFRIRLDQENETYQRSQAVLFPSPETANLEVKNPQLVGRQLSVLPAAIQSDIVISRVYRQGTLFTPRGDTVLEMGDVLLAVGSPPDLERLRLLIGGESRLDLKALPGQLVVSRILVTHREAIGRSIAELQLRSRYGVTVTRVNRAGLEFVPNPAVHLQFGDKLTVVGEPDDNGRAAAFLGNSLKRLDVPNILPIFLGIIAGLLLGSLPIAIPGIPVPLKLGIAGGPLLVAILWGRLGNIGRLSAYISNSANLLLRETGIVLFLAAVGLRAGSEFVPLLLHGSGLLWMGLGAAITLAPVLLVAVVGRLVFKQNYLVLCGLLAGSMTDPPALAFATGYVNSDAPALTYATVYPLVTFLRILSVQLLVLFLGR